MHSVARIRLNESSASMPKKFPEAAMLDRFTNFQAKNVRTGLKRVYKLNAARSTLNINSA